MEDKNPLPNLLKAKAYSDVKDYDSKHRLLYDLVRQSPDDFYIDSEEGSIYGLTHSPTGFKIHVPRKVVDELKLARKEAAKALTPITAGFGQIDTATQKLPSQFGALKSQMRKATKSKDKAAPRSATPETDKYYAKKQQHKFAGLTTGDLSSGLGYAPGTWYDAGDYSADAQRRFGNLVSGVGLSAIGLASIPALQYLFPERFAGKGKNLAALAVLGGMSAPWIANLPGTLSDISSLTGTSNKDYTDEKSKAFRAAQQAKRESSYVVPGALPTLKKQAASNNPAAAPVNSSFFYKNPRKVDPNFFANARLMRPATAFEDPQLGYPSNPNSDDYVRRQPSSFGDMVSFMSANPLMKRDVYEGTVDGKNLGIRHPFSISDSDKKTNSMEADPNLKRIGVTSPRIEYEGVYGKDLTDRLVTSATAAQNTWLQNNPGSLIAPSIPNYDPNLFDRQIPIYEGTARVDKIDRLNKIFPKTISDANAAYVPHVENLPEKEIFIDEGPQFGRYAGGPKATTDNPDFFVGMHETLHSLQNQANRNSNYLSYELLPDKFVENIGGEQTNYSYPIDGSHLLEFPAHLAEMKAHYYKDTGVEPFMDTPDQRKSFMDHWQNALKNPATHSDQIKRFTPVYNYLKMHPDPAESEFLLRSIVSNQPYSNYTKQAAFLDMDMPMVKAHMADVLSEQLRSGHIDYGQAAGMMLNAAKASREPWFTVRDLAHAAIGAGAGAVAGTAAAKGIGLFMNITPTEQKVMQGTGAALGTLINLGKFGF